MDEAGDRGRKNIPIVNDESSYFVCVIQIFCQLLWFFNCAEWDNWKREVGWTGGGKEGRRKDRRIPSMVTIICLEDVGNYEKGGDETRSR